jgi:hypothetical protein
MDQIVDYVKNYKNLRAKISDGSIVIGKINIMSYARLSEYLKQSNDRFITILADDAREFRSLMKSV